MTQLELEQTEKELKAVDITVRFGGVRAIENVSVALKQGEILGLIGPNGAGKTTMVNVLSGFQQPHSGGVHISGVAGARRKADWFARNGVVRTFQAVRLFAGITLSENVEVGLASLGMGRMLARKKAHELLDYLGLADKADVLGRELNYSDERRVGIARALALQPRFLLLDEPAAGMNVAEAEALGVLIRRIHDDFNCGVLVIEHNMALVMNLCQRLHVMAGGRTIAQGTPAEVLANEHFRSAYLGSEVI
ncbi:ABC transporter ATP-binding protein [Brucella tritici]|uniref:ABC transporter ATP-binding protein n=1 Tax=Brucella tritici TaxID=94626 RepID=UPI0015929A54|nr:ABC transporter ATP-binding protein [Brucella tritici]